jgi:F420-non-reducing hydrogenase iron-sulfur subunit
MCSGRVDLEFIFRAFANGQDGVLIGGCRLDECNYTTHGNYDALSNTYICRNIMERIGLNPERLSIEFMSGGDGNRLAEVVNNFTRKVKEIGPLGDAEEIEKNRLKGDLEAVRKMIPYLKLVEREKLRVPVRSEKAYHEFYTSGEANRLFDDLIGDKLTISRIAAILREKPLPTGDIAEILGLDPSEVTKHMNSSSRHGLVEYDMDSKCYALALGGVQK